MTLSSAVVYLAVVYGLVSVAIITWLTIKIARMK